MLQGFNKVNLYSFHAVAGGIGTTAIQLAKLLEAGTVIGTVGSEAKKKLL